MLSQVVEWQSIRDHSSGRWAILERCHPDRSKKACSENLNHALCGMMREISYLFQKFLLVGDDEVWAYKERQVCPFMFAAFSMAGEGIVAFAEDPGTSRSKRYCRWSDIWVRVQGNKPRRLTMVLEVKKDSCSVQFREGAWKVTTGGIKKKWAMAVDDARDKTSGKYWAYAQKDHRLRGAVIGLSLSLKTETEGDGAQQNPLRDSYPDIAAIVATHLKGKKRNCPRPNWIAAYDPDWPAEARGGLLLMAHLHYVGAPRS